jgi:putative tryptophan/tyrosine transport system substrate-binding protein
MQQLAVSRRRFLQGSLGVASLSLLSGCGVLPSQLQPRKKIPRLGFLSPTAPPGPVSAQAFVQALRDLNYVEGETIVIEYRWAEEHEERLPALATELVALEVDVIYGFNTVASRAAKTVTSTIPIVFGPSNDPIGAGLVTNLARPEGNATGVRNSNTGLPSKRLELLKQALPGLSNVGALGYAAGLTTAQDWAETQAAGQQLGLGLRRHDVQVVDDFEISFAAMVAEGADALITLGDSFIARNGGRVVNLAAHYRLPAIYEQRTYADVGGLMCYGASIVAAHRRAALYVDKILKGAKPADLPVEQPTIFDFVINLKTAQALGLTIPQNVIAQATEVIQ